MIIYKFVEKDSAFDFIEIQKSGDQLEIGSYSEGEEPLFYYFDEDQLYKIIGALNEIQKDIRNGRG